MANSPASHHETGPARALNGANGNHRFSRLFADIAHVASREAGRAWVFALAVATIAVWAITGPLFAFSDTWQLVINTGTTIVTFLMVFLIQNSQNRDSAAIQVKLDELIRVGKARNSFVGVEHLTEEEIEEIRRKCEVRSQQAARRPTAPKSSNAAKSSNGPKNSTGSKNSTGPKNSTGLKTS
jgi:low affinity Fe/Cu permease